MEQVPVLAEDQRNLNEFSVLHSRKAIQELDIKNLKTQIEDIVDAKNECELLDEDDGDDIPALKVGDAFFQVSLPVLLDQLEQSEESLEKQVDVLRSSMEKDETRIQELKSMLYSKFHDQINLD
ncbi:CNH domain-containing protein [Schizosaccharomyces pombe]|uniref:Probable prefoldin subunit 4 n=1 Tax=Schizosaccharomyces pombe (strain 972 / ATCC 24843) TaxID=284812 RepID=PFD4_SCHPO|nr:putative prefoldin subunit 4 [Schizosaccharomyces pombe]Q9UTD4.1 RecName: Full=Probable prefoldin subunit 4 [Schizosaccharomyces pombe 972h-]CAB61454.1 prefoldin subunit 4 (predicted) [Schizosaccharomyces pombe]|eukprot:NP_592959.1 putative prefoldin subunit 4 [Schizosaccharomyces pombe]